MLRLASDLHLEFYLDSVLSEGNALFDKLLPEMFQPSEQDKDTVLILAGDILLIKELKHFNYFFEKLSLQFKTVLWIFGNHEWFKSTLNAKSMNKVKEHLAYLKNVHILDNEVFEDEKYYFVGTTLWSDINKGDYLTAHDVALVSKDYKKITFQEGQRYSKMRPRQVSKMFKDNEKFIFDSLLKAKDNDKIKVVVTHHPPTVKAIPEMYKVNSDYWSDFGQVDFDKLYKADILPEFWFHGHIHESQNIDVMGVKVLSNTRGYNEIDKDGKSLITESYSNTFVV